MKTGTFALLDSIADDSGTTFCTLLVPEGDTLQPQRLSSARLSSLWTGALLSFDKVNTALICFALVALEHKIDLTKNASSMDCSTGGAPVTLVPLGTTIEAEVNITAQNIGRIRTGDRVKLDAFPFQRHGTLPGAVRVISENALQHLCRREAKPAAFTRHVSACSPGS